MNCRISRIFNLNKLNIGYWWWLASTILWQIKVQLVETLICKPRLVLVAVPPAPPSPHRSRSSVSASSILISPRAAGVVLRSVRIVMSVPFHEPLLGETRSASSLSPSRRGVIGLFLTGLASLGVTQLPARKSVNETQPFIPKQGIEAVLFKPAASLPTGLQGVTAIFQYGPLRDDVLGGAWTQSGTASDAVLYGAQLFSPQTSQGGDGLLFSPSEWPFAVATGRSQDRVVGRLLQWSQKPLGFNRLFGDGGFAEALAEADRLHGYSPVQREHGSWRRAVVQVVQRNGQPVLAYLYYQNEMLGGSGVWPVLGGDWLSRARVLLGSSEAEKTFDKVGSTLPHKAQEKSSFSSFSSLPLALACWQSCAQSLTRVVLRSVAHVVAGGRFQGKIKFLHTMVRVLDLKKSLDFYKLLGLKERTRFDSEQGRFTLVYLAAPGQEDIDIELTYNWDGDKGLPNDSRHFGHLAYAVENVYEVCQHLMDNGVVINRPPRDGRMAFVRSPDNISIELLQAGKALPPSEPWISMQSTGHW
eukprot:g28980.t1